MSFSSKTALGLIGAGAVAGTYFGVKNTDPNVSSDERVSRAAFMAGAGGLGAAAALGFTRRGGIKFAAQDTFSAVTGVLKTKTGMFLGGGAAVGAAVGAYTSDDATSGAAKGAVIGAGTGLAVRGAMVAANLSKVTKSSFLHAGRSKMGIRGATLLGTMAVAVGAAAMAGVTSESSYSSTTDSGETTYSNSPVKRRVESMNATGDIVLGLHRKRRG